jgi:hypothetical protein
VHPYNGLPVHFESPLPEDMQTLIDRFQDLA